MGFGELQKTAVNDDIDGIFEYLSRVAQFNGRANNKQYCYHELKFVNNPECGNDILDTIEPTLKKIWSGIQRDEKRVSKVRKIKATDFKDCCKELWKLFETPRDEKEDKPIQWHWYDRLREQFEELSPKADNEEAEEFFKNLKPLGTAKGFYDYSLSTLKENTDFSEKFDKLKNLKMLKQLDEGSLLFLVRSLRYQSRQTGKYGQAALARYIWLQKSLKLIDDIKYKNLIATLTYLSELPRYLKRRDLVKYVEKLEQTGYSLHEIVKTIGDKLKNKDAKNERELLWHFLSGAEPKNMKNCVSEEDFCNWNNDTKWELKWVVGDKKPNEHQETAFIEALTSKITLIKGPPGTGKTATILNIMEVIRRCGKTAAVVSSNNSGIDNIKDKIEKMNDTDLIKLAYIPLGNSDKRKEANARLDQDGNGGLKFIEKDENGKKKGDATANGDTFKQAYPLISSTVHSLTKCVADGNTFQYDYVIIDEASQANVLLGIVAMFCAKNLIVVGDEDQLPPVFIRDEKEILEKLTEGKKIQPKHHLRMDIEDKSFLGVCSEVFKKAKENKIMLQRHYRCHHSIISFCNENVYEGKLLDENDEKIVAKKDECRIAVRWYEGQYDEACSRDGAEISGIPLNVGRTTKRNMKQVEIFMREEWPDLKDILVQDILKKNETEKITVAIIAPYVGQINAIHEAIVQNIDTEICAGDNDKETLEKIKRSLKVGGDSSYKSQGNANTNAKEKGDDDGEEKDSNEEKESVNSILTIHKSQGREFDIVYILLVDDGDYEWPWSQKKRLVNVAVSRAKEEVRLITSANMMSEEVCDWLPVAYVKPNTKGKAGSEANCDDAPDNMFFKHLVDYVKETWYNECDESGEPAKEKKLDYEISKLEYLKHISHPSLLQKHRSFGFVKSDTHSIFDCCPEERKERSDRDSAYEGCFIKALKEDKDEDKRFSIEEIKKDDEWKVELVNNKNTSFVMKYGCPLSAMGFKNIDEKWHFDFSFFTNSDNEKPHKETLRLAVEIDGKQHRTGQFDGENKAYIERDKIKDDIVVKQDGKLLTFDEAIKAIEAKQEVPKLEESKSFYFLRLPTDGTTYNEMDIIAALLNRIATKETAKS